MKKIIFILMFVLLSMFVYADQCSVGSDCYIYHNVEVTPYDQVTINVTSENGTLVIPTMNMSLQEGDLYFINYNFQEAGNYTAFIQVLNSSVVQANVTKEFTIFGSRGLLTNVCPSTTGGTITLWLFIGFFLLMFVLGFSMKQMILSLLGAVGLIFASLVVIGCHTAMGVIMFGISIILTALSLLVKI